MTTKASRAPLSPLSSVPRQQAPSIHTAATPSRGVFNAAMEDAPSDDESASAAALTTPLPVSKHSTPAHKAPTPPPQAHLKGPTSNSKPQPHPSSKNKPAHASNAPISRESHATNSISASKAATPMTVAEDSGDEGAALAPGTTSSNHDSALEEVPIENPALSHDAVSAAAAAEAVEDEFQPGSLPLASQALDSIDSVPALKPMPAAASAVKLKGLPSSPGGGDQLSVSEPHAAEVADTLHVDLQRFAVARRRVEQFQESPCEPMPPELAQIQASSVLAPKIDAVLSVDIAAQVQRIVVGAAGRADTLSTILPSPVVMDVADDSGCMEHLQRWVANSNVQNKQSVEQRIDSCDVAADKATEVVLPLSLAQLRQRYNAAASLCVSSEGSQTLLEQVSILCGTWNMAGRMHWPTLLHSWLPFQEYDVYVVASQECEADIVASLHSPEKTEWEAKIRGTIGSKYCMVASETVGALHIAAFVAKRLLPYVKCVEHASVKTGFSGAVSNKGGCAISFNLGATSFLFCSAHLEAHTHNVSARNEGWKRIEFELRKKLLKCREKPEATMASECFDRVVFMGDLNYRVAEEYGAVCEAIARNDMACLLGLDQLQQEIVKNNVFTDYVEHSITFPPTYKFDINSDDYDTSRKARTPSWTDRILYKNNSDLAWECLHYSSVAHIKSSDHRPVHAIFTSVRKQPIEPT